MLNLNELEKKWLRYKIKSYLPHAIILSVFIAVIIIISLVDFSKKTENKTVTPEITKTEEPVIIKEEPAKTVTKSVAQQHISPVNESKMFISPSLDFMKSISRSSPIYYNNAKDEIKPQEEKIVYKKQPQKQEEIEVEEVKTEVVKENTISINRQNTQKDIQHVINRFKKSNNPALSLFIAKKYYELENYNEAYNYALITNELNNDIEDSWIIFAKSLVKLNNKEKAIEMLEKYVSQSHSSQAKILIDNIKSGKIQ